MSRKTVTPGSHSDHLLTRTSSRRLYGKLLENGARVFEYQPAMIHAKTMIIDGLWSVVGSTNFDNRSFGLNDEVNLAACDEKLAARLEEDFARDVSDSRGMKYTQTGTIGGDLGGYYNIYLESTPFTYNGHTIKLKHAMRLLSPLNYKVSVTMSVDGGPFLNFGNPWWRKDPTS